MALSYVLCPMAYGLCPLSYVPCPKSYVVCPMSCVLCPMSYAFNWAFSNHQGALGTETGTVYDYERPRRVATEDLSSASLSALDSDWNTLVGV